MLPGIPTRYQDCTIRALAIASGRPYEECWLALDAAQPGGALEGVDYKVLNRVYKAFGFNLLEYDNIRPVGEVISEHPDCILALLFPKQDGAGRVKGDWAMDCHTMAVQRGRVQDITCPDDLYTAYVCIGVYLKRKNRRKR